MLLAAGHNWQQERSVARWGWALAAILTLHAGAGLSGFIAWNHTEPPAPPPAAIMLELMPVPATPPAPQVTAPPEPTPPSSEPEVDLAQLLPIPDLPLTPPDIPEPEVVLPKPKPEPPKTKVEEPKIEKPKEKKEKLEKPKPESEPEVQKPAPELAQQQAAKAAAPVQPSATPAAPSAADLARVSNAKVTWQGILEAHLRKFRKYPRSALRRNIEGTVLIRFRMDRGGKVLSYSVERTSDHDVLDEAALAMSERANPLPPLPDEVPGESIELIIPANFNITEP